MVRYLIQYKQHKSNAKHRGIGWEFTYVSWRLFWAISGYWYKRGKGKNGYVMARYGDKGPYSPDNCKIIPFMDNVREGHIGKKRSKTTKHKMSEVAKRIAKDPEERKRRSERAKRQHSERNFGSHTWKEGPDRKKLSKAGSSPENIKRLRTHIALQSSSEMSRRSYQRKIFKP